MLEGCPAARTLCQALANCCSTVVAELCGVAACVRGACLRCVCARCAPRGRGCAGYAGTREGCWRERWSVCLGWVGKGWVPAWSAGKERFDGSGEEVVVRQAPY